MLILRQFAIGNGDIISQIYSLLHISDPGVFEAVLFWLAILSTAMRGCFKPVDKSHYPTGLWVRN